MMHKIVYLIADESEMQYNHLGWKRFYIAVVFSSKQTQSLLKRKCNFSC